MTRKQKYGWWTVLGMLLLLGLGATSLYSYLLFHSLAELFSIAVAWAIFMLAWNARRLMDNSYLLFIGIAYLFIGSLDLLHTLGYTGMGVFPGYNTNLPTQLWICARYVEALSLLIGCFFLGRQVRINPVVGTYGVATALLLGSIFYWDVFPTCFVEGVGLTPFKKISEYVISLILLVSIVMLHRKRAAFDAGVLRLLIVSILVTIGSELAFTLYVHAYGLPNLVGHYLKIVSFYLIYKAIIETGLTRPYALFFRELKKSEDALRRAKENLELQVNVRTAELQRTQERLQEAQRLARMGFLTWNLKTNEIAWSDEVYGLYGVDKQKTGVTIELTVGLVHPDDREYVQKNLDSALKGAGEYNIDHRVVRPDGQVIWIHAQAKLALDKDGNPESLLGTVIDITERKKQEEVLQQYQQRLKALASQLTIGEERERRRIAADLHDHVGQQLAFARIQVAAACKATSKAKLTALLEEISETMLQATQDTRNLVSELSSPSMNEIGLAAAISEWLEEQIGKRHGLKTECIDDGQKKPLDDDMRAILFRNVRELLTNVVKHAQASKVTVRLEQADAGLKVIVQDEGVGFDPRAASRGFGLFSIQERMADLGGSLEIVSEPGKGCTAIMIAPLGKGME